MRRWLGLFLAALLTFNLCACGQKTSVLTWQEQYDLGVRYLSEGNYEEAIIAFTAAIEIDPKQADAYIGLADVYIMQGEYEQAITVLKQGQVSAENSNLLSQRLSEVEAILSAATLESQPPETGFTSMSGFKNYTDLPQCFKDLVDEVIAVVEKGGTWRDFYFLLYKHAENNDNESFLTEHDGYRIRYTPGYSYGSIEVRTENGCAYYYDCGSPDKFSTGFCSSWNWSGDCKVYLVYPYIEENAVEGRVGSVTLYSVKDGLVNGEVNSYLCDDDGNPTSRIGSYRFENGKNLDDEEGAVKDGKYENHDSYEEFSLSELWE